MSMEELLLTLDQPHQLLPEQDLVTDGLFTTQVLSGP